MSCIGFKKKKKKLLFFSGKFTVDILHKQPRPRLGILRPQTYMGQVLQRLYSIELQQRQRHHGMCSDFRSIPTTSTSVSPRFPDLSQLPPELGLAVLSYLNPTDLCLAACVWDQLANDELLWQRLVSTLFFKKFNNKLLGYKKNLHC